MPIPTGPDSHVTIKMSQFYVIFNCFISIGICLLLSVCYVASLHIWKSPYSRDHPTTIKRRCISVFFMNFLSPCFLYMGINRDILEKVTMYELLGFKTQGLCQALIMPLFLTMILFLGPICMKINSGIFKLYTVPMYWMVNFKNLIWLRNHLVAPFSEEFTFRSCMLPLLLQCFTPLTAVIICPLFFGVALSIFHPVLEVFHCTQINERHLHGLQSIHHHIFPLLAHFHHMQERIKFNNEQFTTALKIACFQFVYTTIFGMYSAYILLRTGHFLSSFVLHAFCNHMGFPDVVELVNYQREKKFIISALFVLGLILWSLLLNVLTEPSWYHNKPQWFTL